MKIKLTRGKYAIVDEADYQELMKYRWHCDGKGYAKRTFSVNKKPFWAHMHRQLMNPGPGLEVDHINGDRLDNRRNNLRICTKQQNLMNRSINKTKRMSVYKGVTKGYAGHWIGQIRFRTRVITQRCESEVEAASWYNRMAKQIFGDFAKLNDLNK